MQTVSTVPTPHDASMTRRHLLALTGLAGVAAVTGGGAAVAAKGGQGGGGPLPGLHPVRRLQVLPADGARLVAAPATVDIGGGTASALTYNGAMPGPVLVARTGEAPTVTVVNGLGEETTAHWHGLVVPTEVDGQPHDAFAPGEAFRYTLPLRQRAGLNWYHPHPHLRTASQVAYGLAGGFVVRDAEEDALTLPSGELEVPLVIRDAKLDKAGNLTYNGRASGFLGDVALTNGTRRAYLPVDRAVHRLRILNGANSRVFVLTLSGGAPFTLIGNDGGLITTAVQVGRIELSPAERLDLLVDLRGATGPVHLLDASTGWSLLELRPKADAALIPFTALPARLSTIEPLPSPVRTRRFSFDGMTRINGKVYDMHAVEFSVPPGEVERWTFTTNGNAPHPVHVHGASFQVVRRTGGRGQLYPWEAGWKDTVLLNDGETVEVLVRFELEGRYLMHCHKLEHEDAGMMLNFVVANAPATAMSLGTATGSHRH